MVFGLVPNEGLSDELLYIVQKSIVGVSAWELYLFTNNLVPNALTVFADITDATFTGYVHTSLTRASWQTPTLDVDRYVSVWNTVPVILTNTGVTTETIFGYALVDPDLLVLRGIQRFDDCDIVPLAPGGQISIQPKYVLTTQRC